MCHPTAEFRHTTGTLEVCHPRCVCVCVCVCESWKGYVVKHNYQNTILATRSYRASSHSIPPHSAQKLIITQQNPDVEISPSRARTLYIVKVKQSRYRPGVAQRVPGS